MGLYDTLELPAELSLPGLDSDPSTINWQTKSIDRPAMRAFRITRDGRLLQEEARTEEVPVKERPYYGTEKWDEPLFQLAGSMRHIHQGWSERQYHGVIRFVGTVDEDFREYHAKFTDGRLVALRNGSSEDHGAWLPVETLRDATRTAAPDDGIPYKRTATESLADTATVYDVSLPDDVLTATRHDERYLQLLHLPDEQGRHDTRTGNLIARGCVYELVIREPVAIEDRDGQLQPVSPIVERDGPYELESAVRRAVTLAESRQLPIHKEIARLRPAHWSNTSAWVTCPDCRSDDIMLVTDLDATDLTLACRACDARISEADREGMFHEWLHCPSCQSGDVNIELSAPHGSVQWSCDDCGYNTTPAPIDTAYTSARDGESPET